MQVAEFRNDQAAAAAADLVSKAASGDEAAFAEIMARYDRDMARLCHFICRDSQAGEDALQNAWQAAWRSLGTLRDPTSLRPWLLRIAGNEARNLAKVDHRFLSIQRLKGGVEGQVSAPADDRADLVNALRQLSAEEKELIGMRFILGMSSSEIGHALGLNASTVRSRLAVTTERLKGLLGYE